MRKDREAAIQLRKSGFSYKKLHEKLGIPKATLSDWFSHEEWSEKIKTTLDKRARQDHVVRLQELDRIRGANLEKVYAEARKEAREDFAILKYNPLFIAGVMLYWGEGDKRSKHQVRLTNTDSAMIALFAAFLRNSCSIAPTRISAHILIYSDNDPATCIQYWSGESSIPPHKFMKCTLIKGRHKTHRLPYGICMVVVSSSYLKQKMLMWMSLLPRELMDKKYYANIRPLADMV